MSQLQNIFSSIQKEDYSTKKQLLEYTLNMIQQSKKALAAEDRNAILAYADKEIDTMLADISNAANYQEKDQIFTCEDLLLGLIMAACPKSEELPEAMLAKIQALVAVVAKERYLEMMIDKLFDQQAIAEEDVRILLSMAAQAKDEYQKGKLYQGLIHYQGSLAKMSAEAKKCIADHLTAELSHYLDQETHTADSTNNVELMADISKHFMNDTLAAQLLELLKLEHSGICFFAAKSLLETGKDVSDERIAKLAQDMEYANLTYEMLEHVGKTNLFPPECAEPEYLAKSDLVHWLMYPTELGQTPDEIEYIGKIKYLFRKEVYHVFKYRSNSDTLSDELKNKWLVGWSSKNGGTFSNFDRYDLFKKDTTEATLKNIKKKLIG